MIKRISNLYDKTVSFLTNDIWFVATDTLTGSKGFWVKQLKVFLVSFKEFDKNRVNVQASSLTFYLMMTIIPIVAMVFGISKGFGIDQQLIDWLNETFPDQQSILSQIIDFADKTIKDASGGWIAGIGFGVMLWSSMNMIIQVEECFNYIWEAKNNRTWSRRVADYLSVMLLAPLLLVISSSITVTFEYHLMEIPILGRITPFFVSVAPYVLIWILFTLLYIVMPNVKVKIVPALIAGVIAGTSFQLVERLYFYSQVSISKYNAIYGSFAAIPLFLLCAKISWQIVLFGAELSFAYQNIDHYDLEIDSESLSHRNRVILLLYVMEHIVKSFAAGHPPKNNSQLASDLNLSIRAVNLVISDLSRCGMLSEVKMHNEKEYAHQPAMDIHRITIGLVLEKLDNMGAGLLTQQIMPEMERIINLMDGTAEKFNKESGQLTFLEL